MEIGYSISIKLIVSSVATRLMRELRSTHNIKSKPYLTKETMAEVNKKIVKKIVKAVNNFLDIFYNS
jgi:hypothetical protein